MTLLQARQDATSEDEEAAADDARLLGAPDPAAYKGHSSSIIDVLEDLKEKAEAELSDLRKAETNAQHNYNMLKQSLDDQKGADEKTMAETKAAKAEAAETKATAEGDLALTSNDR